MFSQRECLATSIDVRCEHAQRAHAPRRRPYLLKLLAPQQPSKQITVLPLPLQRRRLKEIQQTSLGDEVKIFPFLEAEGGVNIGGGCEGKIYKGFVVCYEGVIGLVEGCALP